MAPVDALTKAREYAAKRIHEYAGYGGSRSTSATRNAVDAETAAGYALFLDRSEEMVMES
jgi:hypothetical protein